MHGGKRSSALVLTSRQNAPTEFLFPTKTAADKPAAAAAVISSNCISSEQEGGKNVRCAEASNCSHKRRS